MGRGFNISCAVLCYTHVARDGNSVCLFLGFCYISLVSQQIQDKYSVGKEVNQVLTVLFFYNTDYIFNVYCCGRKTNYDYDTLVFWQFFWSLWLSHLFHIFHTSCQPLTTQNICLYSLEGYHLWKFNTWFDFFNS